MGDARGRPGVRIGLRAFRLDRPHVTVDVTGTWEGSASNAEGVSWFQFNLVQQGSQVKGSVQGTGLNRSAGQVNGTVAGDVFIFRLTR
jgi:hypothetical protein